ncbi:MAG TPA: prephenate dehydrogenase/arogenate dehydrogenase family protein [Gammaproteobacteria bacterium]|nr:prephenate dehydrogenase/arogenate dehydrogenase family protein [Gammaproteobacteria bacterium]
MIGTLCIIGVGLIGGSVARAARSAGLCREIVGVGRSRAELEKAVALGVIDRFEQDPARAAATADVIMLAVPLGAMEPVLRAIAPAVRAQTIVTDAGSAKGSVVAAARAAFGRLPPHFVPGHPIAGTEKSGVEASFATLFQGRKVILTPEPETSPSALARVQALWQRLGGEVVTMSVERHDTILAATSHLPHVLAYVLVDELARLEEHADIFRFAAGGFKDFTRIASSDPIVWRDICLANRQALVEAVDRYLEALAALRGRIAAADSEVLLEVFERAKRARERACGPQN